MEEGRERERENTRNGRQDSDGPAANGLSMHAANAANAASPQPKARTDATRPSYRTPPVVVPSFPAGGAAVSSTVHFGVCTVYSARSPAAGAGMLSLMYWAMTVILSDRGTLVRLGYAYVPGATLGSSAWLQHVPRPGIGTGKATVVS